MDFTRFPRRRYIKGATPLEHMPRLSEALGGKVDLWIKRDDLLPDAGGGNKTRKLEFCIGEAMEQGADTLITCGAPQSNHCRLTLAWARKEGLGCQLVLKENNPGDFDPKAGGNIFLFHLMGADIKVISGEADMFEEMLKTADELKEAGKKPYVIPIGGSNDVGALGYALFADELMWQLNGTGLRADHLVVPSASAGTHAGAVTGLFANQTGISVTGINIVSHSKDEQEAFVHELALKLAEKLSVPAVPRELVVCSADYIGPGYAMPTEAMKEAVYLFARQEGILLDPVYSGKTAAGLIDFVRRGRFAAGSTAVFLHTGGSPGLYAHQDQFV